MELMQLFKTILKGRILKIGLHVWLIPRRELCSLITCEKLDVNLKD